MSTQRVDANTVINAGGNGNTVRNSSNIISSGVSAGVHHQVISSSLMNEVVLNGNRYNIVKQIARSGEAEVFLVTINGNYLVFKYYYSQYKPKDEILVKLKGLRHPYIIALYDYGYYQDRFFEISEYASGGTLMDNMPLTTLQQTKDIIAQIIDGLNFCHNKGIIHRDIKPENIFYRNPNKKEIALGDFGIASNLKEGEELVRTSMARTSLYAAPELFTNIQGKTTIEKSVDYYALGMTLLQMWFGRDPFEDIDEFGIMRLKSEGKILFPDTIHEDVEKLIKGLITVNPRERWGHDEVRRWLNGDDVKVFYHTIQFDYKPYAFGFFEGEQIVVNNPKDLAMYLEKYPDRAEGHIYRNTIAKWVELIDPGLFNDLMDIVERDYPTDKVGGVTKAIYILDPERSFRGADKSKLRTQEEIAAHFEQNFDYYEKDLQNPNASFYIFLESRNYKESADEYRNYFKLTNPEAALNTLIFKLEGADKLIIDNYTIYQPEELLKVDAATKTKVIDQLSNLNSKVSLWISSFKKVQPTIAKWISLKRFDETTLRYALQEGYVCGGYAACNIQEFEWLLKHSFNDFFLSDQAEKNRDEANYWLTNYMDSSLPMVVLDYLRSGSYQEKEFIELLGYILGRYDETGMTIYELIETFVPHIKNIKSDNKKTGNKILVNTIVEITRSNIETYWSKAATTHSLLFLDSLKEYLSFVERNLQTYPEFFTLLTIQLDSKIRTNIRNDMALVTGDETKTSDYRTDLDGIVSKLKRMNLDLPYIKRYNEEIVFANKQKQEIKKKNAKEKKEKLAITKDKFDKILQKQKDKFKDQTSDDHKESLYSNITVALSGIVFLLAFFLLKVDSPMTGIAIIGIAIMAFLCYRIGNNIAVYITRSNVQKNLVGATIGLYAGIVAGCYLRGYIPVIDEIKPYNFYKELPIAIIFLVALVVLAAFGFKAFTITKKNEQAISGISLPQKEQDALDHNLKEIDRYFAEKESFEYLQETARITALDDRQFDLEFAKVKTS